MFSQEMADVLKSVLTSWYVIGVTIVIILYLSIVRHVAGGYRTPRFVSKSRPKKAKKAAVTTAAAAPQEAEDGEDSNDALGLEEE